MSEPHRTEGDVPVRAPRGEAAKYSFAGLLGLLVFWGLLSYTGLVRPFFLPPPDRVAVAVWDLMVDGTLFRDTLISSERIVLGFFLATVFGVPLGILIGVSRSAERVLSPTNEFLRYLPVASFIPLCILWFGIGTTQKAVVVFLGTFFQLIVLVAGECSRVPRDLIETARTLGAGGRVAIFKVAIPWALPGITEHMRVSLGWAWSYLLVAEIVAANGGLGFRIIQAQRFLRTDQVVGCMLVIGLLGIATDFVWKAISRRVFVWWWTTQTEAA